MSLPSAESRILVIMTGGTICSSTNEAGKRFSDAANVKIVEAYAAGDSPFAGTVSFETFMPTDILSENMTAAAWSTLLEALRTQVAWGAYRGVIMLHGTDTLAYTSSLLSLALAGVSVPVCMVSSQLPLDYEGTNGHANFRAAVELIMNGLAPNVYAVYRNMDGATLLHFGAHLRQCENYSDDFHSVDEVVLEACEDKGFAAPGQAFETNALLLNEMGPIEGSVLRIVPYVGIDYDAFNLENVKAIVHGSYHSESVCVERKAGEGAYSHASILHLLDRCAQAEVPLFVAPCSPAAFKYESTGDALGHGAHFISDMTNEMAYVKVLVGVALGKCGEDLLAFVAGSVNHERIAR